jgi:DNA-binding transcriptional ArsR family regulator
MTLKVKEKTLLIMHLIIEIMQNFNETADTSVQGVNDKLDSIHQDIKRLMEKSNEEYLELMLNSIKKDFTNTIISYIKEDVDNNLEKNMEPCEMKTKCKTIFKDFLGSSAELLKEDNVSEAVINEKQAELNKRCEKAPFDKCDLCFTEVNSLFNKQIRLMHSNQIYNNRNEEKPKISALPEDLLVKNVLEPLSNKQRMQILKSLANKSQTFSALSELTGLRGGNLLFHIQKLQENNMILQRHERGDYMITKKGFNLLVLLTDFQNLIETD